MLRNHKFEFVLVLITSLAFDPVFGLWISDERVTKQNLAPSLGRGYSITTNSFLSHCLFVNGTSLPSFDYDYTFEYFKEKDEDSQRMRKLRTFSKNIMYRTTQNAVRSMSEANKARAEANRVRASTNTQTLLTYKLLGSMKVDRYYSSILESSASLSDDALRLLEDEDYTGFFKSCGTTYVRSLRRSQEVSIEFSFETCNDDLAEEYADSLERYSNGGSSEGVVLGTRDGVVGTEQVNAEPGNDSLCKDTMKDLQRRLKISLKATGIGLGNGTETSFVVSNIAEFNDVMKTAYKAMTRSDGDGYEHAGKVSSIEAYYWTNNPAFQIASKLLDFDITGSVPFNQLTKAPCTRPEENEDSFGFCCLTEEMKDLNDTKTLCRPYRQIPIAVLTNNAEGNGELVATMDIVEKENQHELSTLRECQKQLLQLERDVDYRYLVSDFGQKLTVKELKMILDPTNGKHDLTRLVEIEVMEHRTQFSDKCYQALYSDQDRDDRDDTDLEFAMGGKYFFANSNIDLKECSYMSCKVSGRRWDRDVDGGGCVPGILRNGPKYDANNQSPNCEEEFDSNTGEFKCKYDSKELRELQDTIKNCWNAFANINVMGALENFCRSGLKLSNEEAEGGQRDEIDDKANVCEAYGNTCSTNADCEKFGFHYFCYPDSGTPNSGTCKPGNIQERKKCLADESCSDDPPKYCSSNELCEKKVELGGDCTTDVQCLRGYCVDEICSCDQALCDKEGKYCNTKTHRCDAKTQNGDQCTETAGCLRGVCDFSSGRNDGVCSCTYDDCQAEGEYLYCDRDRHECRARKNLGDSCEVENTNQCLKGTCQSNKCSCNQVEALCHEEGQYCNTRTGKCEAKNEFGKRCSDDDGCLRGECSSAGKNGVCTCIDAECKNEGEYLYCDKNTHECRARKNFGGTCKVENENECLRGECRGSKCSCTYAECEKEGEYLYCDAETGKCGARKNFGGACKVENENECLRGECRGSKCSCTDAECEKEGKYCDAETGKCGARQNFGGPCNNQDECLKGDCDSSGKCSCTDKFCEDRGQYCKPSVSRQCQKKKTDGKPCGSAEECLGGTCSDDNQCKGVNHLPKSCQESGGCSQDEYCNTDSKCETKKPDGGICTEDVECSGGYCPLSDKICQGGGTLHDGEMCGPNCRNAGGKCVKVGKCTSK